MGSSRGFTIVGAGLAGVRAAETLRAEGFDGPIVLVGDEPHRPYERPPLSKAYLQGTQPRQEVFVHPATWFDEQGIELRPGAPAVAIDRAAKEVVLAHGERIGYEALLLATGSSPRRLAVPGADMSGVRYLRTLDDADALRAGLATATRVVVIGGGWIGLEVAAAARGAGLAVTVLERLELPLVGVLGPQVAAAFAELHRRHGVDVRGGVKVRRLIADGDRFAGVELDDGTRIDADLAVVGVGITPNTAIAEACGLHVSDGVLVDEHLRSSDPRIWAAGDVANARHPVLGRHIRVEHWANAQNQGPAAARSMLGQDVAYTELPFFYTDQYDLGMEYVGHAQPGTYDRVVLRGDFDGLRFLAFWLAGNRVLAGMHVNVWDSTGAIRDLVASGREVDATTLADTAVPLSDV